MGKLIFSGSALFVAGGFLLMACCFFGCAGVIVFAVATDFDNDANEIKTLAEFSASGDNQKVYSTGTISGTEAVTNDPVAGDISAYELVGYQVDRWDVSRGTTSTGSNRSRRTTYNGSWVNVSSGFAPFQLDNGTITVNPNDTVEMDGDVHEYMVTGGSGNGMSATYEGQTLRDGTFRVRGFQNGDLVTVVGIRRTGLTLDGERIFGGTRDELVKDLESQADTSRTVGYIVGACGFCFLLPGLALAATSVYGRRWFRSTPPQPAFGQAPLPGAFGSSPVNTASPFGAPATPPPASNIPSGSFWSDSSKPAEPSSPFNPPANAPSPFDPPKDASDAAFGSSYEPPNETNGSPFDPPKQS